MAGGGVGPQGAGDDGERVEATALEGAVDGHQHGAGLGAAVAHVAVAGLAHQHRRPNFALGLVVVRGHAVKLDECQQRLAVLQQPLRQPPRVWVRPFGHRQIDHAALQLGMFQIVSVGRHLVARSRQPDRVAIQTPQPLEELRPVVAVLGAFVHLRQVAEQMRPTLLLQACDRVVGRPEIRYQHAIELRHEELVQGRMAARAIELVEGRVAGTETPQPPGFALDPPAGLVGVQDAGVETVPVDLLVPRPKYVGQPMPHRHRAAGRPLELQVLVEDFDDLADRDPQAVVQPSAQGHGAVAQRALRQRVRDFRLELLLTARAPIAVDRVFDCLGFQVVGNVFDDARARLAGTLQFATALRTDGKLMGFLTVDASGLFARMSGMAVLAAAFLAPRPGFRFGVRWQRARGCVGSAGGRRGPTGDHDAQLQQQEDERRPIAAGHGGLGLGFGERAGTECRRELRIETRSRGRHRPERLP